MNSLLTNLAQSILGKLGTLSSGAVEYADAESPLTLLVSDQELDANWRNRQNDSLAGRGTAALLTFSEVVEEPVGVLRVTFRITITEQVDQNRGSTGTQLTAREWCLSLWGNLANWQPSAAWSPTYSPRIEDEGSDGELIITAFEARTQTAISIE